MEALLDELHKNLKVTAAKFPIADVTYHPDSFQLKYQYYKEDLMPRLEQQRKNFLSENWQPNDDWWGSQWFLGMYAGFKLSIIEESMEKKHKKSVPTSLGSEHIADYIKTIL